MTRDNTIIVGNKNLMNYVKSIELFFKKLNKREVILSARGNNIKAAVDIAESSKNKFLKHLNIYIKDVKISTVKFYDSEEIERSVSSIEIKLISK